MKKIANMHPVLVLFLFIALMAAVIGITHLLNLATEWRVGAVVGVLLLFGYLLYRNTGNDKPGPYK